MAGLRWVVAAVPDSRHQAMAEALNISPFIAALLWERGVRHIEHGARFLNPSLDHQHSPDLMPDIDLAVQRLVAAIQSGEKIVVHGDYDVDGVCSAALLTRVLRVFKAEVEAFVPHRREHGYDLRAESVRRFVAEGAKVILTADCGIIAFEAAEVAAELGVDLIITDHHEPSPDGDLPRALAVINPHRPDSDYPFAELCGTAVAFKLAAALVRAMGVEGGRFQTAVMDLVALATCADCMPLLDENRAFVQHGLEALRKTNKAGLKALMKSADLRPEAINARAIGFVLAPRINAIGRMDAAGLALELLLTSEADKAEYLAARLNEANTERRQQQEQILQDAMRQAERYVDDRILVLASHRWHPGIIGIVASKVAEALCRPTILIALDEETGLGRGSCRSIAGFHIFDAINECREYLTRCGGHAAAAGFDIEAGRVESFRLALQDYARAAMDDSLLEATLEVALELPHQALDLSLLRDLARLEPYGHANAEPVFMTRGMKVREQRRIANRAGQGPDHLKLALELDGGRVLEAVYWRAWPRAEECAVGARIDACFTLEENTYRGAQLQLKLCDFRPAD